MSNRRISPALFEKMARNAFNENQHTNAQKCRVDIREKQHEFDFYQEDIVVGGISTSAWINRTAKHSNNTGGQDRVIAELFWLQLCTSAKRKVLILKEMDMAEGINKRFGGCNFFNPTVEVWLYDQATNAINHLMDL